MSAGSHRKAASKNTQAQLSTGRALLRKEAPAGRAAMEAPVQDPPVRPAPRALAAPV